MCCSLQSVVQATPAAYTQVLIHGLQKDGMREKERQQLAAEAHKAARGAGLKDIMAANASGGVTRDSLRKANPLAVKVRLCSKPSTHTCALPPWFPHQIGRYPLAQLGAGNIAVVRPAIKGMISEKARVGQSCS